MRLLARAAAAALVIAFGAEIAARRFLALDALVYRDSDDPKLAYELRPDSSGMKNGVPVQINAQGLRDEPVPAAKAPGERRVLVVGGHETFGVAVEAKDTFVRELADGLVDPREGRARTINLSMYSYHLGQKVELACQRLPVLAPELAVLQISESDGGRPYPPLLNRPRLKNWIREHSVLARWIGERRYLHDRPFVPPADDLEKAEEQVKRFKGCADAAGAQAVVLLMPDIGVPRTSTPSDIRRGVESAAKELSIPLIDAGAALGAVPPAERAAIPNNHFLSPAAHRAVADEVRRRLRPLLKKKHPAPSALPSA
jgi:hypothetical protein